MIGESPPDPGTGPRRFFFAPELTYDNLYRGVAEALYGARRDVDITNKPATLQRICADGLWLIDAVEQPINKRNGATRARAIRAGVPRLVQRCRELDPELGVIVCHGKVHEAAASSLHADGVRVLHAEPLPFPLGNWRARFVEGFRRALVTTLPDELQVRLRSALGDDVDWPARPIEALDGRNVIELGADRRSSSARTVRRAVILLLGRGIGCFGGTAECVNSRGGLSMGERALPGRGLSLNRVSLSSG